MIALRSWVCSITCNSRSRIKDYLSLYEKVLRNNHHPSSTVIGTGTYPTEIYFFGLASFSTSCRTGVATSDWTLHLQRGTEREAASRHTCVGCAWRMDRRLLRALLVIGMIVKYGEGHLEGKEFQQFQQSLPICKWEQSFGQH